MCPILFITTSTAQWEGLYTSDPLYDIQYLGITQHINQYIAFLHNYA